MSSWGLWGLHTAAIDYERLDDEPPQDRDDEVDCPSCGQISLLHEVSRNGGHCLYCGVYDHNLDLGRRYSRRSSTDGIRYAHVVEADVAEDLHRLAARTGGGDCYRAAGRYILDNPTANVHLVHGDVDGRGAISGTRMGHAWIEDGDEVIDRSNGREVRLPKHVYYALGNISGVVRYTPEEAMAMMGDTEHFGPWHETGAAHSAGNVVDHGTEWDEPEDDEWDPEKDWIGSGPPDDDDHHTAARTAMPAPMPEGITFHYHNLEWCDPKHRPQVCDSCPGDRCLSTPTRPDTFPPFVQAIDEKGNYVGHLNIGWETASGKELDDMDVDDPLYDKYITVPDNIHVEPEYRRQNVANGMFDFTKGIFPELQHSRYLSELGRLWSDHEKSRHARRLAMPLPMPEGITFHHHPTNDTIPTDPFPATRPPHEQVPRFSAPAVEARHNGETVGYLEWDPPLHATVVNGIQYGDHPPEVSMIKVHPDYRRHGIATALFDFARQHQGDLEHSDSRTGLGNLWVDYERSRSRALASTAGSAPDL